MAEELIGAVDQVDDHGTTLPPTGGKMKARSEVSRSGPTRRRGTGGPKSTPGYVVRMTRCFTFRNSFASVMWSSMTSGPVAISV